jgi:YesN/AraC family two-component response regulator
LFFTHIEARDGLEASWKIQNDKIDILITDIRMPKKNGIEIVESLLRQKDKKPQLIIIVSGNVDAESVKKVPPSKTVK